MLFRWRYEHYRFYDLKEFGFSVEQGAMLLIPFKEAIAICEKVTFGNLSLSGIFLY